MKKEMNPRMHSAEHLLNQTMVRMFNCGRCFSSHIEKKKSKCDYHFERALEEEEMEEIQKRVNRVIQADLPVSEEYVDRGEAKERYNLDRLPEDAGDPIRIIKMGDYDACPCIGPHVQSTKDIGGFGIVSTSFENGVLRIRYKLDKSVRQ
jgi:misacylated tRNA(Ala) deacylase